MPMRWLPFNCSSGPDDEPPPIETTDTKAAMTILSLPPELTTEFFFHLVQLDPPKTSLPVSLGWINVTFVCQSWRNLALACASLWTDISGEFGLSWVNAFLERSQQAPLTLREFDYDSRYFHLDDILQRTLHRIRFFSLANVSGLACGSLVISRPAPDMQSFHLTGRPFHPHFPESSDDSATELFAANAPRLRALLLHDISPFPWNSMVLSGLVSMDLRYWTWGEWETTGIFSALRNTQCLEHLAVHCQIHMEVMSNTDIVELNHLKTLRIGGNRTFFSYVYGHLRFPCSVRLVITSMVLDPTHIRAEVQTFLALLSTRPSRHPFDGYKTLAMCPTSDSDLWLSVEAWDEELPFTVTTAPPASFTFTLQPQWFMNERPPLAEVYELVVAALRFPNTRVLRLKGDNNNAELFRALGHLPRTISTLSFAYGRNDDPSTLSDILSRITVALRSGEGGIRELLFPKLQTLSFALEQYRLMTRIVPHHGSVERPTRLLDVLRSFVASRQKNGGERLQTIYVHSSTLRTNSTSDRVEIPPELVSLITEHTSPEN
ncbi:hypothetical protein PENSPDRAFT_375105 [Peniophora sp. CONT]|nr:hypothetical protein PENSPDRAFT_375105 [Peniophora sp. CONT]